MLAWPSLQVLAMIFCFFVLILGGEQTDFRELPVKYFQAADSEEGLKTLRQLFGSFFGSFLCALQTLDRFELKFFRGQFRSANVPP